MWRLFVAVVVHGLCSVHSVLQRAKVYRRDQTTHTFTDVLYAYTQHIQLCTYVYTYMLRSALHTIHHTQATQTLASRARERSCGDKGSKCEEGIIRVLGECVYVVHVVLCV